MSTLSEQLKQALSALAYADAGEMLSGIDKDRLLGFGRVTPERPAPAAAAPGAHGEIGLYLGAVLAPAVILYAAQSCMQMDAGLTVVTFQPEEQARSLLVPYLEVPDAAVPAWRIVRLRGDPWKALSQYLRGASRMRFLVCGEEGFFGHQVRHGIDPRLDFGLPIVMVAGARNASAAPAALPV